MFKIGIVGAGGIAAPHKKAITEHKECELCAVCDIDIDRAKKCAEGTAAQIFTNYKDMAKIRS